MNWNDYWFYLFIAVALSRSTTYHILIHILCWMIRLLEIIGGRVERLEKAFVRRSERLLVASMGEDFLND